MKKFTDIRRKYEFKYTRDGKPASFFIFSTSAEDAMAQWNQQYGRVYTLISPPKVY
jgi:hypothetical protein